MCGVGGNAKSVYGGAGLFNEPDLKVLSPSFIFPLGWYSQANIWFVWYPRWWMALYLFPITNTQSKVILMLLTLYHCNGGETNANARYLNSQAQFWERRRHYHSQSNKVLRECFLQMNELIRCTNFYCQRDFGFLHSIPGTVPIMHLFPGRRRFISLQMP